MKILAPLALVLCLVSCGGTHSTCSAANCPGCCDAMDMCQGGKQASACGESGARCASCSSNQVCTLGACTASSGAGGGTQSSTGGGAQSGTGGGTQSGTGGGTHSGTGGGTQTGSGGGVNGDGGGISGDGGGVSGSGGGIDGSGGGSFGTGGGSTGTGGGSFGTGGGTGTGGGSASNPCTNTALQCVDASGSGDYACVDPSTSTGFPANAPTCASDPDCPTNYHCWQATGITACLQACGLP